MSALKDLEVEKGIEFDVLLEAIEAALISAYKKNFGSTQNVRASIDRDSGEYKVFTRRLVVEEVSDPKLEISLEDALKIRPDFAPEDIVEDDVTPREFGRIAAQTAKQVVVQRIREAERDMIFEKYYSQRGDIITGIIHRSENRFVYIDMGNTEVCLSPNEQMPGENYQPGMRLKAFIIDVKKTTKGPQIQVSRTHPGFLERLFELEVPEIQDGTVMVMSVAREAGYRSKIAVWSDNDNVDALGACVGPKGMRVQSVVNELRGEKVDIIKWNEEPTEFIASALSPAKVISVEILDGDRGSLVVVPDYQLSLAIGKEGQNARLAAKLTGWKIDIKSETQYAMMMDSGSDTDDADDYEDDWEDGDWNEDEWDEESLTDEELVTSEAGEEPYDDETQHENGEAAELILEDALDESIEEGFELVEGSELDEDTVMPAEDMA